MRGREGGGTSKFGKKDIFYDVTLIKYFQNCRRRAGAPPNPPLERG